MELIHYGATEYIPEMVKPIQNMEHVKPYGGLYTCPVGTKFGWIDWCAGHSEFHCDENIYFKLKLKEDAKLLIIDKEADVLALPTRSMLDIIHLADYEALAKQYDAIWITASGVRAGRYQIDILFLGWDVETVLIMNPLCCTQIP